MPKGSTRVCQAPTDAHARDDLVMPIKTVIASLASRSKEDREALLQALMDGDAPTPEPHPVSGTTIQKSSQNQSFRLHSGPDCSPRVSPNALPDHGLRHSDCTGSGEANCSPEVSPNELPCGMWRRGAVYQYRTRVPADLIAIVGRHRINRSLKTASLSVARRSVRATAYDIERQFGALRQVGGAAAVQDRIVVAKPSITSSPVDRNSLTSCSLTFAEVCERYLTDPTISRTTKSAVVYRSTFATITDILGSEMLFNSISRDGCRGVLNVLQKLPPNARKRWPGSSPRAIAAEAEKRGDGGMSVANINEYMNKLSSLFNWAVKEEIIHRNPARGLRMVDTRMARDKRLPFESWQLKRMFEAPLYRGCRDDENGYAFHGDSRPRRARFWIPLVALWAGLRQGEICQMLTGDVRELDGVLCFVVSATEGDGKRLKTAASYRVVPVHPELLRIGFAKYVSDRRRGKDVRLFPDLTEDSLGLYSGKFSKWFARFLISCDAVRERTCFHAFRHTFRDGLREAKIDRDIALTLGGWTTSTGAGAVADSYGQGYSPRILYAAMSAIAYPALDLSHLHTEPLIG
jgi:integrase